MYIGTQLIAIGTSTRDYDTGWFPKGADNAVLFFEVIQENYGSGGSFTVTGYTKNREDSGSQGTSFSFSKFGSSDFYRALPTNLKQLVRFKLTLVPGTSPTGPAGVCFRFLSPTWFDKAV